MGDSLGDVAELFGMALELLGLALGLLCFGAALLPLILVFKLFGRISDGPKKANDKRTADDPANRN